MEPPRLAGARRRPPLPPQATRPSKAPPPLPPSGAPPAGTPSPSMAAVVPARSVEIDTPPTPIPSAAQRRDPAALIPAVLFELLAARDGALSEVDDKVSLARVRLELSR